MSAAAIARVAYGQYLCAEATSDTKHEWLDGAVVAMAGGTPERSLLKTNLARAVGNALAGKPCRSFDSDLRVTGCTQAGNAPARRAATSPAGASFVR